MSAKKTKLYILILEIDPMSVGALYSNGLHTTVVYWFFSDSNSADIAAQVAAIAKKHKSFEITATTKENFGEEEDLEVYLIEKTKEIVALHEGLLEALQGVEYDNVKYQRDGWRPHVTTQGDKSFPTGSKHTVKNMYLIEALNCDKDDDKIVRAKVELETGEITA